MTNVNFLPHDMFPKHDKNVFTNARNSSALNILFLASKEFHIRRRYVPAAERSLGFPCETLMPIGLVVQGFVFLPFVMKAKLWPSTNGPECFHQET